MTKIAVIILNWNGKDMLNRFLPSVIEHSTTEDTEIYVADNGSEDDSIDFVKQNFPTVKILDLKENNGFAKGYNIAIKQIEAEYVVLLNSDVEVTKKWLEPLLSFMEKNENVAACQPKILSYHDKSSFEYAGASGGFIDRYGYPFCRGRIFDCLEKDEGQYDNAIPIFWATGAALFIRRDEYISCGGLDDTFFAHMEEIDLCWRIKARGKEIYCLPSSKVYHVGGGTLSSDSPQKTYLNFRNNLIMLYKNLPEKEMKEVLRIRNILDYIAAIMFIFKRDIAKAKAIIKAKRDFKKSKDKYQKAREENLQKAVKEPIKGKVIFSILKEYYIKRNKSFSNIKG